MSSSLPAAAAGGSFQDPRVILHAPRSRVGLHGLRPKHIRTALVWSCLVLAVSTQTAWGQAVPQRQLPTGAPPTARAPALPPAIDVDPAAATRKEIPTPPAITWPGGFEPEQLVSPRGLSSTLNLMLVMTILSLAPSILMMTTCFIRFIIVLGLLRQALGTQQLPPNQVLVSLSLFLTFMVMSPVWQEAYSQGIRPYTDPAPGAVRPSLEETFQQTALPLRRFMSDQIERAGDSETVWMFIEYQRPAEGTTAARECREPQTYEEVPLSVLLPSFMLSELKTAFIIGFQLYLPFVIIDMVIAAVLISMGMMMLPPVLVSLPFKLLLFVLIDGWGLTMGMLLTSVRPLG